MDGYWSDRYLCFLIRHQDCLLSVCPHHYISARFSIKVSFCTETKDLLDSIEVIVPFLQSVAQIVGQYYVLHLCRSSCQYSIGRAVERHHSYLSYTTERRKCLLKETAQAASTSTSSRTSLWIEYESMREFWRIEKNSLRRKRGLPVEPRTLAVPKLGRSHTPCGDLSVGAYCPAPVSYRRFEQRND